MKTPSHSLGLPASPSAPPRLRARPFFPGLFPYAACILAALLLARCAFAQTTADILNTIGVTALRTLDPTLTGSGINALQIESPDVDFTDSFEVNPNNPGQPVSLFTWVSGSGTAITFPNKVGTESGHANAVADNFYHLDESGQFYSPAPGLKHVWEWNSELFYPKIITGRRATSARLYNQSFYLDNTTGLVDPRYDNYIAQYHTLIISGAGDGGAIVSPADCYNDIAVAAYGGTSSVGPTSDGRCKPDITAPASETSFSTPWVSGGAAILMQVANRNKVTAPAALDSRTMKALLLNGAVKPSGWTASATAPLDYTYGAGILNVLNSYNDIQAGRHAPVAITIPHTAGHLPLTTGTAAAAPLGWDYRSVTSTAALQGVNHYRLATTGSGALIATLVWDKHFGTAKINNLFLYLYDSTGTLLASSISTLDNVQHLYVQNLAAGTYDIEVVKAAGKLGAAGSVSGTETYALAWDFQR